MTQGFSGNKFAGVASKDWAEITSSSSQTGWSAAGLTFNVYSRKILDIWFIRFIVDGTSNSTSASITLPNTTYNAAAAFSTPIAAYDNSADINTTAMANINAGTAVISFIKAMSGAAWTALGNKICSGEIWYKT